MVWFFLAFQLVAFSGVSQRCKDFESQVENILADQLKAQTKTKELEGKLKLVLQQEITAQVEKQDTSEAEGAATAIYYELRKSRIEGERWTKTLASLRKQDCDYCEKEGASLDGPARICKLCPQAKTCVNRGGK